MPRTGLFCVFVYLCGISLANADPAIWRVQGKHNSVYLLGTVHMLRSDAQLPDNVKKAYGDAKQLLMELDMDALDPIEVQGLMFKLGMLPDSQTLQQQLNADTNAKLQKALTEIGLDAAMLSHFQPWLAALTLEELHYAKLGYAADAGIDMQLTAQASLDHKPIHGLETMEQQLNLFAQMSAQAQREYLNHTLSELNDAPNELEELLSAWRQGDDAAMQKMLQQGFADDPQLFTALTSTRNRRWMTTIESVLDQQTDNYLVAVGALHLIGDDGLVALLKRAGYKITRQQ